MYIEAEDDLVLTARLNLLLYRMPQIYLQLKPFQVQGRRMLGLKEPPRTDGDLSF